MFMIHILFYFYNLAFKFTMKKFEIISIHASSIKMGTHKIFLNDV